MSRSLLWLLLAALLVAGVYFVFDPSEGGLFPRCPFHMLTGWQCPGCGSQRAIHALLNGDVKEAFGYNAMMMVAIPWIVVCLFAESQRTRRPRLYQRLNAPLLIWLFLVMVLAWWLLRNIFDW